MAAGNLIIYDSFKEYTGDGTIDLDDNTFKAGLYLSNSNIATLTHTQRSQLTAEHAADFGYVAGGVTLSGVTWGRSGSTTKFTASPIEFNAVGGSLVARFLGIYRSGTVNGVLDALVGWILLNTAGGGTDVTVIDGQVLRITPHANGLFTVSGATT